MNDKLLMLSTKLRALLSSKEGQDLIEYSMVFALIAFAATASMSALSVDINSVFTNFGTTFSSATT